MSIYSKVCAGDIFMFYPIESDTKAGFLVYKVSEVIRLRFPIEKGSTTVLTKRNMVFISAFLLLYL